MEENFRNFTDENGCRLNIVDFSKQARNLPYFHQHPATNLNPVLTGVHSSKKGQAEFTLRFSDASYVMALTWRKKGVLPINGRGRFTLRCNKRTCHAKTEVSYKLPKEHLTDFAQNKHALRDVKNWQVHPFCDKPHTCQKKVKFFHSDRENFGDDYIEKMLIHVSADQAFNQTRKEWASGLGSEFDGIISGLKVYFIEQK